ncbi:phosphate-starvation-inducible PsiE family protein [Deferribacter thermophilus]|uniref:phosphate-starvation-inducible PsiE family protein n=1 Tax=Deferribacter thermophilus TaxID=53573 RepID=UPI003C1D54BA
MNIRKITPLYELSEKDRENIRSIKDEMIKFKNEFVEDFYNYMNKKFDFTERIEKEKFIVHREKLKLWYEKFFDANFKNDYFQYLINASHKHVDLKIEETAINVMFSFLRRWFHEKIFFIINDDYKRKEILISVHKALDMNAAIMSMAYHNEQIKKFTSIFSFKDMVISFSERFMFVMNSLLIIFLVILTINAAYLFFSELLEAYSHSSGKLLITALGSMLILWVLIELLHTEIQLLKGGKFKISIFIGVALIAFIRDLLIITLKHEAINKGTIFVLASILILGLIYWLTARLEKIENVKRGSR